MNRQAKLKTSDQWHDFGRVTLEDAAIQMANRSGNGADRIEVVVRDDADRIEFRMVVESVRSYRVSGLRGGE